MYAYTLIYIYSSVHLIINYLVSDSKIQGPFSPVKDTVWYKQREELHRRGG